MSSDSHGREASILPAPPSSKPVPLGAHCTWQGNRGVILRCLCRSGSPRWRFVDSNTQLLCFLLMRQTGSGLWYHSEFIIWVTCAMLTCWVHCCPLTPLPGRGWTGLLCHLAENGGSGRKSLSDADGRVTPSGEVLVLQVRKINLGRGPHRGFAGNHKPEVTLRKQWCGASFGQDARVPGRNQQSLLQEMGLHRYPKHLALCAYLSHYENLPSIQKLRQEDQRTSQSHIGDHVQSGGAGVWLSGGILKTHLRAEGVQLGVGVSQVI